MLLSNEYIIISHKEINKFLEANFTWKKHKKTSLDFLQEQECKG